jgi:Ca2+-binding RTX toxin-like protein
MGRKQLSAAASGIAILAISLLGSSSAEGAVLRDLGSGNGTAYSASPGETNYLKVSVLPHPLGRSYPIVLFSDAGATTIEVEPGTGCVVESTASGSSAYCEGYKLGSININLGDGNDQLSVEGNANGLSLLNVLAGPGRDRILGSPVADDIHGGSGRDYLAGLDGNDTLLGNDGNDQLLGGADADNLQGGFGNDKVYGGQGDDLVGGDFSIGYGSYQGNDYLYGGTGNDVLGAWSGINLLEGGSGSDTLWSKGHNHIDAGSGSNVINLLPAYDRSQLVCGTGTNNLYWMEKPHHVPGKPPWVTTGSAGFGSLWVYIRTSWC